MEKLAVIDIGSNSITLMLVEIIKNKYFKIQDILKETVRLGQGMNEEEGLIKKDRIDAAIKTLKMFKNLCNATETEKIIAVATAAVRKASNKQTFLDRVKTEINMDVKVLSGKEECYFDYSGVVNTIKEKDGLIIDIGGGSVELVLMKNRRIKESISLPFGALDLTEKFNLYNSIDDDKEKKLKDFIVSRYEEINWLSNLREIPLIGIGGTIRNIAKIDQNIKDYPLDILHNYHMESRQVKKIYNFVREKNLEERLNITALSKKRADIFVGATALISVLIEKFYFKELIICGKGIREGLIYDYLYNDEYLEKDVLDLSIDNILANYKINLKHSEHVFELTLKLYQELKDLFTYSFDNMENIIKVAAKLHDCGKTINYYDHHEHSFYSILNSGINGLTHRELLIIAYIAASHRHKKYRLRKYNLNRSSFFPVIEKNGKDKELIRKIGILMEIAESLDRNMNGIVRDIECEIKPESVLIKTIAKEDLELEINDALVASEGFKYYFKKELNII